MKPGNLLVNSNCLLKICDFGLARSKEHNESIVMTQEVVTQVNLKIEKMLKVRRLIYEVN